MSAAATVICGVGAWVPSRTVKNAELIRNLDTSDAWIRERTGIASRHRVDVGMSTSDLAVEAGALAMKSAGAGTADALILATTTPDRPLPGTAPTVAHRLGLGRVAAHDVAAACTGFLYGLASAAGMIATGTASRVLVIGADAFSTVLNHADRTTAALFGDGAGAVVVRAGEPDEAGAVGPVRLHSDGGGVDMALIPAGGSVSRSTPRVPAPEEHCYRMDGRAIYRRAVDSMVAVSGDVLGRADWTVDDVDRLAAHQANARICSAVADRLGVPKSRRLANVERVGNTVGASLPLLLAQSAARGELAPGHRVLLTAFGAGLTWGGTTLVWPDVVAHAEHGSPHPTS